MSVIKLNLQKCFKCGRDFVKNDEIVLIQWIYNTKAGMVGQVFLCGKCKRKI